MHKILLKIEVKIFRENELEMTMKVYYTVLYAVYTIILLRIFLTILMRYMFLYKLMEFTRVYHTKH